MEYEKIHRKAEYILRKIKYLKNNRPEDAERFKSDETMQMAIFYGIQVCIEAIVDIVILTGTKVYEKEYEGDYEMFESLFEEGVIEEDVFEKLRKMNGLRNAIVHAYDSLIVEEIYDNYNGILRDIGYVTDKLVSKL
ncbi:MAG: hypothetical protein DIAAKJNI_00229 [Candidatus Argoarchaeum ethanivorans]|uniref:DUF86 domain-containing protein n=1 Tax=Candidatus Argoarchaeum ethanivorans TaxID=2608793 RepID=A0A811TC68_9EURY|nr:MAG: hypothetical protein DIAAKJNI_00229 [Candidatus Argoarchaeum ethanivorans]